MSFGRSSGEESHNDTHRDSGMKTVVALVDRNFYASCEKLFRPDLRDAPVIVLSNNDLRVARSREAKTLGIKMGVPVHHIRSEIRLHGIHLFSSNYELYGDLSRRVMTTLEALAPRVDVYSMRLSWIFQALTGSMITRCIGFSLGKLKRLLDGIATIDHQILASNHGSSVAGQKQGSGGYFFRLSEAARRNEPLHLLAHLTGPGLTAKLGHDHGWRNGVDLDALG